MRIEIESLNDALFVYKHGLTDCVTMGDDWLHYASMLYTESRKSVWVLDIWHDTWSENNGHTLGRIVCDAGDVSTIRSEWLSGHGTELRQPDSVDPYLRAAQKYSELQLIWERDCD